MDEPVRDDAAHLKSLRTAAGLDIAELAAKANLSAGQVRQLEEGGESLFYSAQIKNQSLRRVIRLLEQAPETATDTLNPAERPVRTGESVIDDIIRLSEKNLKSHVVTSQVRRPGSSQAKFLLLMTFGAALVALIAWQFNRHQSQALYTEWVEPMTANVLQEPVVKDDVQTQQMQVEIVPVVQTLQAPAPIPTPAPIVPSSSPLAAPAPAPSPVASHATATDDCSQLGGEPMPIATAVHNKAGTYVHLFSNKAIKVCVDDGKKTHTLVSLAPGVGKSVYGVSPWTVSSSEMKSLQIYFQGGKVLLPPDAGSRIYLKEQAVSP